MSELDEAFEALATRGDPRGASAVFAAATTAIHGRNGVRRRPSPRLLAGAIIVAAAAIAGLVWVSTTGDERSADTVAVGEPAATAAGPAAATPTESPFDGPNLLVDRSGSGLGELSPSGADVAGSLEEAVRTELLGLDDLGSSVAERRRLVASGGLEIELTVDADLQATAEAAPAEVVPDDLAGNMATGFAAVDVETGAIRALHYDDPEAAGAHPIGSLVHLFTMAAAFAAGDYDLDSPLDGGSPCDFELDGGSLRLENFGEGNHPVDTLVAQAMRASRCAFARLEHAVGTELVAAEVAELTGVESDAFVTGALLEEATPALTPAEVARAMVPPANGGVAVEPHVVRRVTETATGDVLYEREPAVPNQVMEPAHAAMLDEVLRRVVAGGTGTRARLSNETAGLTGTRADFTSAWFAGYDDGLASAVWIGTAEDQTPLEIVGGGRLTGGSYPAQLWAFINEYRVS